MKEYALVGQKDEFYLCEVCGQVVRVARAGPGALFCCGEPMRLLDPDEVKRLGLEKQ